MRHEVRAQVINGFGVITVLGTARSGTTAVGVLLASASHAQYINEPHGLAHLVNVKARGGLSDSDFRELVSTYLFWDCLVPSLTGRSINTNEHDQTWAGHWLGSTGLQERLSRSWRFSDIEQHLAIQTLVVKFVDQSLSVLAASSQLSERPLFLLRDPLAVASSVIDRGYYRDPDTLVNAQPLVSRHPDGTRVPVHVPDDLAEIWVTGTQIDRCGISSLAHLRTLTGVSAGVIVDYARIHPDAGGQGREAMIALGLTPTSTTGDLESYFLPKRSVASISWDDFNKSIRQELFDLWNLWSSRACTDVYVFG
jgi:hypothetical protein